MDDLEDSAPRGSSAGKLAWERPTVTLAGTISLLVRMGSPQSKPGGSFDGDGGQFQTRGGGGTP